VPVGFDLLSMNDSERRVEQPRLRPRRCRVARRTRQFGREHCTNSGFGEASGLVNPDVDDVRAAADRAIRAAVGQRFAQVARSPGPERKFPVGPASARKLGYDPQEIDALPPPVTESFCGTGNPLGLGEGPAEGDSLPCTG
jgi:hypothetical protein